MFKQTMKAVLGKFGYTIRRKLPDLSVVDLDADHVFTALEPMSMKNSMTSRERLYALYKTIEYIVKNEIKGDIVECGVWRGGSMMMAAQALLHLGDTSRTLWLYDTFAGMSEPSAQDSLFDGRTEQQAMLDSGAATMGEWCNASLDVVRRNLGETKYPASQMRFIVGKVEDTIPQTLPERIACLRLDTDFYESTYHEFVHLFPKLERGGVIIIDDYGHHVGARAATDRYLTENAVPMLLNRIDYTGRIAVKQ
ncbi:MAG: hypothetical protein NVS4B3_27130 [Gemmatimonadaceae bacterium]